MYFLARLDGFLHVACSCQSMQGCSNAVCWPSEVREFGAFPGAASFCFEGVFSPEPLKDFCISTGLFTCLQDCICGGGGWA